MWSYCGKRVGFGDTSPRNGADGRPNAMLAKSNRRQARVWIAKCDAYWEWTTVQTRKATSLHPRCLHRVTDRRASCFWIYKSNACSDWLTPRQDVFGCPNPMLAKSDRHKSKPSAVVMTKAVLAKSKRQLCKHQFVCEKTHSASHLRATSQSPFFSFPGGRFLRLLRRDM